MRVSTTVLDRPKFVSEVPPKRSSKESSYAAIIAMLDAKRGQWAQIAETPSASINAAATHLRQKFGAYDFAVRSNGDGLYRLYACKR